MAHRFDIADIEDLEGELLERLLAFKNEPPKGIRAWKPYLAKFLSNKASNWVRNRRRRQKHALPLADSSADVFDDNAGGGSGPRAFAPSTPSTDELRVAFAAVWGELSPAWRLTWEILLDERGNQARTARRLGLHRNTVRQHLIEIRRVLKRHGFSDLARSPSSPPLLHNRVTTLSRWDGPTGQGDPARLRSDARRLERRRLRAARLLHKGISEADVARRVGVHRQSVNRWAQRLAERGAEALRRASRTGRPPRLRRQNVLALERRLKRDALTNRRSVWTAARVAALIEREHGVKYSRVQAWRLFLRGKPGPRRSH